MSQHADTTGKSKHHGLIPSFLRTKHHLRKHHKTTPVDNRKGKDRAEDPPSDGADVSLMGHITAAAANQQGIPPDHDCHCDICTSAITDAETAKGTPDFSLMGYIQDAATGEAKPEVNCECAICALNNPDEAQPTEQSYFSVPRDPDAMDMNPAPCPPALRSRIYNTPHFSGRAPPGPLVNNIETEELQYPQIVIPSLEDPLSIYIPSDAAVATNTTTYRGPVIASPSNMDPQFMDTPPPIPAALLKSLASRERGARDGGEHH